MTKKILVLGTSTIGHAVADEYRSRGHSVTVAGRKSAETFDLYDFKTWGILDREFDEIHFTIHDPRGGIEQAQWAVSALHRLLKRPVRIVVYSSEWGSIETTTSASNYPMDYKMAKAALNMGVKCLALRAECIAKFLLIHPGAFRSPLNQRCLTDAQDCAVALVNYLGEWDEEFAFVDVTTGHNVPY